MNALPFDLPLSESRQAGFFTQGREATGWDFLGSAPVPVRQQVMQGVSSCLAEHVRHGGAPLRACFPMGQGGRTPFDELTRVFRYEDLPAMLVSADDELLFDARLQSQFARGYMAVQPEAPPEVFLRAGLLDPLGRIGLFGVAPFVMLVDRRKLGRLPPPRSWADVFHPRYARQVVLGGWKRPESPSLTHYNGYLLQALGERFGEEGVHALAHNVGAFLHSAQMPRLAGTQRSPGGIYLLPWALADLCPRRDTTSVVWPEEGALAYPLWSTVRADREEDLHPLVAYFRSSRLGALLERNRYLFVGSSDRSHLPKSANLWWPGWPALRAPDAALRRGRTTSRFFALWDPEPLGRGEADTRCA